MGTKYASQEGAREKAPESGARIQEICDQLHRLEALISMTVAVPVTQHGGDGPANPSFVFFPQAFEPPRRR